MLRQASMKIDSEFFCVAIVVNVSSKVDEWLRVDWLQVRGLSLAPPALQAFYIVYAVDFEKFVL